MGDVWGIEEGVHEVSRGIEHVEVGVNCGWSWHTMLEIVAFIKEEGARPSFDASQLGGVHAVWGTRCVRVPASVFWPWAAGLAGIEVTGTYSTVQTLLDFDLMEANPADHKVGLHVYTTDADWKPIRDVSLSVGEFWDAICALAGASEPASEWLHPTVTEDWG